MYLQDDCSFQVLIAGSSPLAAAAKQLLHVRTMSRLVNVSKSLCLISSDKSLKVDGGEVQCVRFASDKDRQLVVLLAWMMAKHKHIMKYANFYMQQGFDVLAVNITPWQLLWPVSGSQVVASDLLQFLNANKIYNSILLHGFSVGAYVWSEALVKIKDNSELYRPVFDSIIGQVWDSAADITEIPVGFPQAVFPRNPILQSAFRKYLRYHLQKFHIAATAHYIRASQIFYSGFLRVPALFLLSKTDPIGALGSNTRCREGWDALGMKTYMKCWDKSPHVGHFRKHPEEYLAELSTFLNRLDEDVSANKIRAKL
ncbi:hypothetical protein PR048_030271 [Dryococelus australis]|uniref:Transmembrane protein 53 n=1 Tax=Dryococelus australis TaxID=614101 RepID=A0ABQ9G8J9_9NEOP|nr:hypothetical protein PR048_030271 [Dryococelus australis]